MLTRGFTALEYALFRLEKELPELGIETVAALAAIVNKLSGLVQTRADQLTDDCGSSPGRLVCD